MHSICNRGNGSSSLLASILILLRPRGDGIITLRCNVAYPADKQKSRVYHARVFVLIEKRQSRPLTYVIIGPPSLPEI